MIDDRFDEDTYRGKSYEVIKREVDAVTFQLAGVIVEQRRLKGECRELKRLFPDKQRYRKLIAYLEKTDEKKADPRVVGELFATMDTLRSVRKRSIKLHRRGLKLSKATEKIEKRHDMERKLKWIKEYESRHRMCGEA